MNLVTGATGIIGSHVVLALLRAGKPVTACRQKTSDIQKVQTLFSYYTAESALLFSKIKWVDLDLHDSFSIEDALEGIDEVYHCAGFVSFNRHHRKQLMEVNHHGTRLLVNVCLQKKIKAFCHVSSIATLNNLDYTLPLNEDVFWKTSGEESAYAISKYNAEREVWRGMEEGLNAVIVNPGLVLSPGFWDQSSSRLFKTCYQGNRFYTAGTTGYVAATDVADIMLQLMDKKLFSNRYLLIENNYTFKEVISQINKRFNKAVPAFKANKLILNIGWVFDSLFSFISGRKPQITRALINASQSSQLYTNHKIKTALSYTFTSMNKTVDDICTIYLAEKSK